MIVAARIVEIVPIIIVVTTSARGGAIAFSVTGTAHRGSSGGVSRATTWPSGFGGSGQPQPAQVERERDEDIPRIAPAEPFRE